MACAWFVLDFCSLSLIHIFFKLSGGGKYKRVVSSSSTPDSSTPDSSTIYALQLLIASHKQFRGVLGGRAPSFSI